MSRAVFISHSDKDRALADAFLRALEQRGIGCWIAPRDIPPGGSYAESIMSAIEDASGFILIYTKHSNVSPHVLREVEQALRFRKNIMPVRFDDSPVSKALDYLLATVHWLSAMPKPEAIEKVAEQIAASLLPAANDKEVAKVKVTPVPVRLQISSRKRALVWLSLLVLVLIAVSIGWRALRRSPSTLAVGENILAAENGGQILVAPNANWAGTIDGKEDQVFWFMPGDEGVFGFENETSSTFSGFSLLIPDSDTHNLKEFELLVGDESPLGHFRSIGKFATQNIRTTTNDGYQQFSFATVKAKYLKVKLLSPHDSDDKRICLYEFRLLGERQAAPAKPATVSHSAGMNLLSPDNGGSVAFAPNDNWRQTVDDRDDQVFWFEPREEGVYQFKDAGAATFDSFGVLIPDNDEHNLRDFELLAGDESPRGEFRLIDRFKTHNARVGPTGYQNFKFPAVTAKYLKVRLLSSHSPNDPRIYLYEFRVFGQLEK